MSPEAAALVDELGLAQAAVTSARAALRSALDRQAAVLVALGRAAVSLTLVAARLGKVQGHALSVDERRRMAAAFRQARRRVTARHAQLVGVGSPGVIEASRLALTQTETTMPPKLLKRTTITEEFTEAPNELSGVEDNLGGAENTDVEAEESEDAEQLSECSPRTTKPPKRGGR